jgi:transcriptional regulator with XRE-family HTH domain
MFYDGRVISGALLREARRRAGLSQVELGLRVGRHQSQIARWERGAVEPSLETLRRLVDACDLELTIGLGNRDDSYSAEAAERLRLTPAERLARAIFSANAVRSLRLQSAENGTSAPFDPIPLLGQLEATGIRYLLIGALAGVLRGSPLLPVDATIALVPGPLESIDRFEAALEEIGASRSETDARLWRSPAAAIEIEGSPPGTAGYADLRRDATRIEVAPALPVVTASLADLVRIAEASSEPGSRAQALALRAALELADE